MSRFLFFLGQNQPLSAAELTSLFTKVTFETREPHLLSADLPKISSSLLCRLGGTVKIAQGIGDYSEDNLKDKLLEVLGSSKNFSLTYLDHQSTQDLSEEIKQQLRGHHPTRYLIAEDHHGLSPVAIQKKKVTEIFIDPKQKQLYSTIWTHNFRHWVVRDRNKPYITPKTGMLPPKLARIMVNLGIADKDPKTSTLLDPFCGTGTILMEASLLGAQIIGSDISDKQVNGAQQNLNWLPQDHFCAPNSHQPKFLVTDATHVSEKVPQVDVIVTEPYLGPANPRPNQIPNFQRGLHKLYLGCFKDWFKVLPQGGRIVFAYPVFTASRRPQPWVNLIDTCENLGYNCLQQLDFTRPGADIFRKILVFQKNTKNQ